MRTSETRELVGLALVTAAIALACERLPHRVAVGDLLLAGALVLLVQGLTRDIGRWRSARAAARRATASGTSGANATRVTCVCVESTIGVSAIVAGAVLSLAWASLRVGMPAAAWPMGFAAVGAFGFLTKDVVIDWKQRRVRREEDHGAVVTLRGDGRG
jgi:hypothetical protein